MAQVIQLAKLTGWRVYHTHDSRRSVDGFPDLVLLKGKRIIVAELKVGENTTTADQDAWLYAFHEAGVQACVWYPSNWPVIERELTGQWATTDRQSGRTVVYGVDGQGTS